MTIQNAYNQWAQTYDTDDNLTRDLDAVVTKNALENVHVKAILELGCGTGKNTLLLAQLADTVIALDFSQEMLAKASAKINIPAVRFFQTDLTEPWPRLGHAIDLIVCNLVLEHIEDLAFIFSEAARVLGAGGRFFISELHPFKQYRGTQARFTQGGKTTLVQAYAHHTSDFLRAAFASGFDLVELGEWWHDNDVDTPPRLISFMFEKKTV